MIHLEQHISKGGNLMVCQNLPFEIKRVFFIQTNGKEFGNHAHKQCHQILISAKGVIEVKIHRKNKWETIILDNASKGLHIKPYEWAIEKPLSKNAVCLVLCSHEYDNNDYITDFNQYINYDQC